MVSNLSTTLKVIHIRVFIYIVDLIGFKEQIINLIKNTPQYQIPNFRSSSDQRVVENPISIESVSRNLEFN